MAFIVLAAVTILTWYKILFEVFKGEGYTYFGIRFANLSKMDKLFGHDTGARLAFGLLENSFKDNLFLYQVFALFTLITLSILFYLLVWEMSRKKITAFIAALLFSVSFNGNFQMMAIGNYQFFVQRLLFFLFLFPSALYLVKYLRVRHEKYFLLSASIYLVSLYLSRFSIFFLPFIISYLFVFILFSSAGLKEKIMLILRGVIFYLIPSYIFLFLESRTGGSYLLSDKTLPAFLIAEKASIADLLQRQFTILMIPSQVFDVFSQMFLGLRSMESTIQSINLPVLIFFTAVIAYILVKNKNARVPVVAAALFLPSFFILNIYTRGVVYVAHILPGDRSLFASLIGYSIIFSYFFVSLFSHKNMLLKFFACSLIVFLVYTNIRTIWIRIDRELQDHLLIRESLQYIKSISPTLSRDSIVVVPSNVGVYGARFAERYYGKEETAFFTFSIDWAEQLKRPFDPQKDLILEYDKKERKVIDKTNQYEEILLENQKKYHTTIPR